MPTTLIGLVLLAIAFLGSVNAHAEDFPGFQINGVVGWVETSNTPTKRIKVLPIVSGPGGIYWSTATNPWGFTPYDPAAQSEGLHLMGDGRLRFGFRVVTNIKFLPPGLKEQVAGQIGVPPQSLTQHVISFVKPRAVTVKLEVAGSILDSLTLTPDLFPDDITDYFYIDMDNDTLISAIRRGEYRLIMDYQASYASYGLVEISLDQKILTTAWTETFRELIKRRRSNSTGFLFFKFRQEVQRVIARENFRSDANTRIQQNLAITRTDADPSQVALIDKALGILESSRSEIVTLHTAALAAARAANDPKLAAAHEKYLENLSTETSGNTDWLTALQQLTDDKVLRFLAGGFQASDGSSYSYFRYNGTSLISANTTASSQYSDFLIRNSEVSLMQTAEGNREAIASGFRHMRAKYFGNFGPSNAWEWGAGVRDIIVAGDLGGLKFAFSDAFVLGIQSGPLHLIEIDLRLDANHNTALHLAVNRQDPRMVKLLLARGANPGSKNRFQESPIDLAVKLGNQAITSALRAAEKPDGVIRIIVTTPAGQIVPPPSLFPYGKQSKFTQLNPTETLIEVSGFPSLFEGEWAIAYHAQVPSSSLPSIGYPFTPIGQAGQTTTIEFWIAIQNQYKMFPGRTHEYRETVTLKNGMLRNQ